MFDALLLTGLLVMPIGVLLLGAAMFRDPGFGKAAGVASLTLDIIGLAAAVVVLIDPRSMASALGWKVFRLSKRA